MAVNPFLAADRGLRFLMKLRSWAPRIWADVLQDEANWKIQKAERLLGQAEKLTRTAMGVRVMITNHDLEPERAKSHSDFARDLADVKDGVSVPFTNHDPSV